MLQTQVCVCVCVSAFVRSKLLHYCTVLPTHPGNRMIKENKAFLYGSLCLYCGYCLCSSGAETLQPCQLKLPVTPTQIKYCHLWRPCIAFTYTHICKVDLMYVSVWQRVCCSMYNKDCFNLGLILHDDNNIKWHYCSVSFAYVFTFKFVLSKVTLPQKNLYCL